LAALSQVGKFKQSYYNDHHESDMVLKDRFERYIPEMDRDELRQPLWVQLTLREYNALAAATVKGTGELPRGYRYTVASGGGGRTQTQMVELHVDDSDHFDLVRAASPLGGSFSVRWPGRPQSPLSAPPANLPHPAADTVATTAPEVATAALGAAEGVAVEQLPLLSNAAINALKVGELRAACTERGLLSDGLKAMLVTRLKKHAAAQRERAAVGADAEGGTEPEEPDSYDVKKIHSMELRDGAVFYTVEWEGWFDESGKPELTEEPEQHLDGCDDALAAFYSDPEHRCQDCEYGVLHHSSHAVRPVLAAPPSKSEAWPRLPTLNLDRSVDPTRQATARKCASATVRSTTLAKTRASSRRSSTQRPSGSSRACVVCERRRKGLARWSLPCRTRYAALVSQ
jgi:hypothetical protein